MCCLIITIASTEGATRGTVSGNPQSFLAVEEGNLFFLTDRTANGSNQEDLESLSVGATVFKKLLCFLFTDTECIFQACFLIIFNTGLHVLCCSSFMLYSSNTRRIKFHSVFLIPSTRKKGPAHPRSIWIFNSKSIAVNWVMTPSS